MTRMTAKDFPQELLELYDNYAHGAISRRDFLDRAQRFAVGGVTAAALLSMLSPDYALADQVAADDPGISGERVSYPSPRGSGAVNAYMVRPAAAAGPLPSVVVVHENRGLNPYIEDVARRLAKAGFLALAPDGLTSQGGYPGNDEAGRELQAKVDPAKLMEDFFAAVEWLKVQPGSTGAVGIVGFCYGGGVANAAAVALPDLKAAVAFYGRQPPATDAAKIRAALMLHYAELDTRITEGWPAWEAGLKAAGVSYEGFVYPGVNHGFHNDTTPRYDAAAAELAWSRTAAFFRSHLA